MYHRIIVDPEPGIISISSEDQVVIISIIKEMSCFVKVTNATTQIIHDDHVAIDLFGQ